jgi:hypothetical protein
MVFFRFKNMYLLEIGLKKNPEQQIIVQNKRCEGEKNNPVCQLGINVSKWSSSIMACVMSDVHMCSGHEHKNEGEVSFWLQKP